MSSPRRYFARDLVWNFASVAVLGVSGIVVNVLIGRVYGAAVFGAFSQVLSIYYVLAQLAVGGFAFSTMRYTGEHKGDTRLAGQFIVAALWATAILAALVCALAYAGAPGLAALFGSPAIGPGVRWILPGLWCFAINKILLYALNGMGHMRAFAAGNSARFLLITVLFLALIAVGAKAEILPLCISAGEILLLPGLLFYVAYCRCLRVGPGMSHCLRAHLSFGLRSSLSGLLMDINHKTDILVLGLFASDATVGIYSFAAMGAEALYQLIIAVQSNITPLLTAMKSAGNEQALRPLIVKNARLLCPAMAAVSIIATALFPAAVTLLTGNPDLASGWVYFAILMTGLTISASYLPFFYVLNQWGHPTAFLVFVALITSTNIALNLLFAWRWGSHGAACATALGFVMVIPYLKLIVRAMTKVRI